MALYNEILVGRFNRGLQKLLALKGKTGSPQLAGEIMAVIPLFHGNEERYLDATDLFGMGVQQPNVAAANSAVRFRNPATSNTIACIIKLAISSSVVDQVNIRVGATAADLATSQPNLALDARTQRPSSAISTSRQASGAAPTFGGTLALFFALASNNSDFILFEDQEIPILPGFALQVDQVGVNETLVVNVMWRERFLEDSERT